MKDYSIKADFVKSTLTVNKDIELVENDYNSTTLNFTFVQAIRTGERVVIAFKKPDESPRVDDVTIDTTTTGHYDIGAILDQDGPYYFTLVLYLDNARLSLTEAVMFTVKGELISDLETITADDDRLPILTSLISEVTAKLSEANTLISGIETSLANGDFDGADGKEITSISKTSTVENVDTYTITFSDSTTSTFTITNGTNGTDGKSLEFNWSETQLGIRVAGTAEYTYVDLKGAKGATGKGITSIAKTSTDGLVDTYTITYSDATTSTYTVTNGANGITPLKDTDYFDGEDGKGIVSIIKTSTEGLIDTYTITYTDSTTSTFTVVNGADGTGTGDEVTTNKVTSIDSNSTDTQYPSAKCVYTIIGDIESLLAEV